MGITYTTIHIRNPYLEQSALELSAKVDTGATLLVLPELVARQLQFPKIRTERVKYADERIEELDVVWGVELEVCNRKGVFEALVMPGKSYALLGAVVMESLDLIVEPRGLGLYPNPRSPIPMAELE